jgi:hypothetical protein
MFPMRSVPRLYNEEQLQLSRVMWLDTKTYSLTDRQLQCDFDFDLIKPCGGGVDYLHRDPASRRRRRKGKSKN